MAQQKAAPNRLEGKLTLIDATAQSIGFMGPVFSMAFLVPLLVGMNASEKGAGMAAPLAVLLAAVGVLGPWICTDIGLPVLRKPTVAFTVAGGRFESNLMLYKVPQRTAFAFGFCSIVSDPHVITPPASVCVQAVLLKPESPDVPSIVEPGC